MVRNFAKEFRAFAVKGNMIDLAVAVVIGSAFSKVITSIVENVITPLISYVTPDTDFSTYHIGKVKIGLLLNDLLSFLLIALAVFIVIMKLVGYLMKKKEEPTAPLPPTKEEALLMEIRDILKNRPA